MKYKLILLLIVIFVVSFFVGCDSRKGNKFFYEMGEFKVKSSTELENKYNINPETAYKDWPVDALSELIPQFSTVYKFYSDNSDADDYLWNFSDFTKVKAKEYATSTGRSIYLSDIDLYLYEKYGFNDSILEFYEVAVKDGLTGRTSYYYTSPQLGLKITNVDEEIVATLVSSTKRLINSTGREVNYPIYISNNVKYENKIITIEFTDTNSYLTQNIKLPDIKIVIDTSEPITKSRTINYPTTITLDNKFENSGWLKSGNLMSPMNFSRTSNVIQFNNEYLNRMSKIQ